MENNQNVQACGFFAGYIAGVCGTLLGHPTDTLKVRRQFEKLGLLHSIATVYHNEGVLGYFKGVSFPLFTKGIINSVYFGFYASTLRILTGVQSTSIGEVSLRSYPIETFIASMVASGTLVIVSNPVEVTKIRLQLDKVGKHRRRLRSMVKSIYSQAGIFGFYKGIAATALRDLPQYTAFPTVYKVVIGSFKPLPGPETLKQILAGGLTGVVCWSGIVPVDLVKSRLQSDNFVNPKFNGLLDCFMKTYKTEGLHIFYRGFMFGCTRAFLVNAVILPVYENCAVLCDRKLVEVEGNDEEITTQDDSLEH